MQQERLFLRLDDDPLYAPETTVPAGTLRELAVPAVLQAQISHLIAYEEQLPEDAMVNERVLPDGALRLIFEFGAGAVQVAGPNVRPVLLSMRGHVQGLSMTLRPGAALALFGVPGHELTGRIVDWDSLVAARHRGLRVQLQEANCDTRRVEILLSALHAMLRPVDAADLCKVMQAATLLRPAGEARRMAVVAAAVGVGERRLQQIFRMQLGLSPRTWSRLARMHGCFRRLRQTSPPRWNELALACGFYDQPHLVNEFQAFCGLTPRQFLQRRGVSGSSKTAD
ncbi:helix-turn-helix domain-containing protein [Variovorax sp. M-6]|uniref:helix-turn-helix domain-containing protein n=1 Tax=Variovorax sp. M-6 TaxID=3233041 RepID=UPI003F979F6D